MRVYEYIIIRKQDICQADAKRNVPDASKLIKQLF